MLSDNTKDQPTSTELFQQFDHNIRTLKSHRSKIHDICVQLTVQSNLRQQRDDNEHKKED